jgi:hypothetical protein
MDTDHLHPALTDHLTVVSDHHAPTVSADTVVLVVFLLCCVAIGLVIKLCVVLLSNWR